MKPFFIELKVKDTERIDWRKALSSYLKRSYGSHQWSQFYDEETTRELDHIRNNANGELSPDALLEQNCKYYAYIEQLGMRLGKNTTQLRLDFTWYDAAYSLTPRDQKYTQHTLVFEKSSVLYNIGIVLTELARDKINEDYKVSIGYLARAMMCFRYISENFLNSPSLDIQAENANFIMNLCHAEAQELFLMRVINSTNAEKQASLISKLAIGAFHLYEKCFEFLKTPEGGITPYGEARWSTIVACKMHFYRSFACYYHATFLEEQNKIGDGIAFLKISLASINSAFPYKVWLKDHIDFEGFKTTVETKLKQLTKDNDYIYHDSIPQVVSVESIKSMDAIKAPTWLDQLSPYIASSSTKCDLIFKGIVPMDVYEKESIYSEEKANLLRRETEATETSNLEYMSFIEFANLPKLLADLERKYKNGGIDTQTDPQLAFMRDQLKSWSHTVRTSNFKDMDIFLKQITERRQKISAVLSSLPDSQKENVVKLKSSLVQASRSDDKLFSLMKPYINEIKLLENEDLLWKNFNKFDTSSSNAPSLLDIDDTKSAEILSKIEKVRLLADDLRVLKEDRNNTLEELKEKLNEDDITNLLILNKASSETDLRDLFSSELEKFSPLSSRIEAAIFKQNSLINQIKIHLDNIFALSGFKEKASEDLNKDDERNDFFEKITQAVTNFSIFTTDVQKGLQFYDSLLKMSDELLKASRNNNVSGTSAQSETAPALPEYPPSANNITSRPFSRVAPPDPLVNAMQDLSLSSRQPGPAIPPRTYNEIPPAYSLEMPPHFTPPNVQQLQAPIIPFKQSTNGTSGSFSTTQQHENEEREIQRNPTAFYNKSSVFDENLYSKYSR
ncbi:hypothetical protein KAFR_0I00750 [Kazachstania africana CBS 2517]|uniref:BRO domain-containing protein 1 n=1 Tax=Kazachstania africana (strain ATCC 22294 / BCRC 22015 / CBS 2517 / CECT 1963 / NBRC 1671 / NRRL Y-8276) TaxID=1071382 RepID=H2AZQ6_KAZAF|nr:hypothetical protein KAFR_0I00750 [Kazachstania africana CBS 2517]CCF59856.1 hypothetical protein KAFR_0I00750 [Kazachstania africana CBS 2517]